jgi:DNA mismatch endonuclease (patch repair protein)
MVDRLSQAQRSRNMARIRGSNTRPERVLRSGLHRAGFRFRLHPRELPGRPDLVMRKYSVVIFVHGCFWHRHSGCANATSPKTRPVFWARKLNGNRRRDGRQIRSLLKAGWRVLVVWECALDKPALQAKTAAQAGGWVQGKSRYSEIPPGIKPLVGACVVNIR